MSVRVGKVHSDSLHVNLVLGSWRKATKGLYTRIRQKLEKLNAQRGKTKLISFSNSANLDCVLDTNNKFAPALANSKA